MLGEENMYITVHVWGGNLCARTDWALKSISTHGFKFQNRVAGFFRYHPKHQSPKARSLPRQSVASWTKYTLNSHVTPILYCCSIFFPWGYRCLWQIQRKPHKSKLPLGKTRVNCISVYTFPSHCRATNINKTYVHLHISILQGRPPGKQHEVIPWEGPQPFREQDMGKLRSGEKGKSSNPTGG